MSQDQLYQNSDAIAQEEMLRLPLVDLATAALGDLARLPDGQFVRFRTTPHSIRKHGWAIRLLETVTLGSFTSGERVRVRLDKDTLPDPAETRKQRRAQHQARDARQTRAAATARALWNRSVTVIDDHPYLYKKRIWGHDVKKRVSFSGEQLIVPLTDRALNGTLWNVQLIDPEGGKKFLPGGRAAGCFFTIAACFAVSDPWLVCEGYATGCALAMATCLPVCCAMSCGNLVATARQVRSEFPAAAIIVCADNDAHTNGNPGLTHARQAAAAVNGKVVLPSEPYNDFNDQWVATRKIQL